MRKRTFKQTERKSEAGAETRRAVLPPDLDVLDSHALFRRRSEVMILHEGRLYRLRKTRNGGLLLNR